MGSLYRNGKYTYFSYRENGKNFSISLGKIPTLTNGRKKELKRKYEVRYEDNRLKNPKSKTTHNLINVIDTFMEDRWKKVKMKSLSTNTVGGDEKKLKYFKDFVLDKFGNLTIEDIDDNVLNDYTDYCRDVKKINPTSIHNYHKSVQPLIKFSMIKGWVTENPYDKVDIPKPIQRTKDDIPTKEETKIIKDHLVEFVNDYLNGDEPFRLINIISYFQIRLGMRVGEVLMMKWKKGRDDVGEKHSYSYVYLNSNLTSLTIHFKKRKRILPIKDELSNLLKKIKSDNKSRLYVLENNLRKKDGSRHPQSTNKRYKTSYCSRPLKRLLRELNIDDKYSTHCLRHSFVTDLIRKDISLTKIGNVVGHSDIRMTQLYGHLDETDMVSVLDSVL